MIKVTNLSKTYFVTKPFDFVRFLFNRPAKPGFKALNSLNFSIADGEVVGLIGPNGAGKTTTIKLLTGLLRPTAGEVQIDAYTPADLITEFKKTITLFRGNVPLLDDGVVIKDSFEDKLKIYGCRKLAHNQPLQALIMLAKISRFLVKTPEELSLGQRTWVELVYALAHFPQYLFLDEPTIGLDLTVQIRFKAVIAHLVKAYQPTILITSHDLQTVVDICPRLILINKGKVMIDKPTEAAIKGSTIDKKIIFSLKQPLPKKMALPANSVYQFPKLTLLTPREKLQTTIIDWSKKIDYLDIDITEPPLEQIFAQYYR